MMNDALDCLSYLTPQELAELDSLLQPSNPFQPRIPTAKQQQFLDATELEVLFGGAAAGGKSVGLLMGAAQYVHVPGYAALILRRSRADLGLPGGLIDRSREWWSGKAKWNGSTYRWTFPSGAVVQFGYCDHPGDEYRYKSSEFCFIGFDEITEFGEEPYLYLFSRLRRPRGMDVPLRMRGATNPGGVGHVWIKRRFIEESAPDRRFIPSRIEDNPHADLEEYEKSLAKLPPLERARLRDGNWDAIASEHFKLDWLLRYTWRGDYIVLPDSKQQHLLKDLQRFGTADIAASTRTTADHTVISAWAITPRHELVWLDCVRGKWEVPDIVPQLQKVYDKWGLQYIGIEGGGTQQGVYQMARRTKMAVKELHPGGQDKLVRATPAIILAESGRLYLPASGTWLDAAMAEVLAFTGDPRRDASDDIVDTLSYAAKIVTGKEDQANKGFAPQVWGGAGR